MFYLRKKRDFYSKKAKQEGFRSRAAYKLLQIDKKFNIFRENQTIIDLCGAPGGFSQIARDQTQSKAAIFLVDMARVRPIPKITEIIQGDITQLDTIHLLQESIIKHGVEHREHIVLADCSPNVSGHWVTDHARQIWLAEVSLGISNYFLASAFLTKVFHGEYFKDLIAKIKEYYEVVKVHKPPTSRSSSAETYIVATKGKGRGKVKYNIAFLLLADEG